MIEDLTFPTNPAFFGKTKALSTGATDTLIEYCRKENIPFNQADAVLYKYQKQKDYFQIFKVIFNSLVNNRLPSPEAVRLYNTVLARPEV